MLYTITPYDQIYPVEIAPPIYQRRGALLLEMRPGAYGAQAVCRVHTTDLSQYLMEEYRRL